MFEYMKLWLGSKLPKDEKGQDLSEYALLIGFIALVVLVAVTLLGTNISGVFTAIANAVAGWVVGP